MYIGEVQHLHRATGDCRRLDGEVAVRRRRERQGKLIRIAQQRHGRGTQFNGGQTQQAQTGLLGRDGPIPFPDHGTQGHGLPVSPPGQNSRDQGAGQRHQPGDHLENRDTHDPI